MSMINYLARKGQVPASLRAINSAILSGVPIIIGYTTQNLRFGIMAENYLHIGGKSYYFPIGAASPETVARELREHAEEMSHSVKILFSKTCNQRGQLGTYWWADNTHQKSFKITDSYLD